MKVNESQKFVIGMFLIIAVLICSTFFTINYGNKNNVNHNNRLDSVGADTIVSTQVLTFEYNGDKYIEFIRIDGETDRSYVVHDPKCPCMTNKLNNITNVITKNTNNKISEVDKNNRKNFRVIIDKIAEIEKKINTSNQKSPKKTTIIKKQTNKKK